MFAIGIVETIVLSLLAFAGAISLSLRARLDGRAETATAAGILWLTIILVPIYLLGLTNLLTRTTLALVSALFSTIVIAVSAIGKQPRAWLAQILREALGIASIPFDGVREAWNARSVALIGILFSAGLVGWTGIAAYFTPSWRQWDALWYHEPIVAFTIQNHGFSVVPLPLDGLEKINGYPRLCEMTQLWFVIFTDRRFVDIANNLLAPLFMLVVYLLAKRQSSDRVVSMGWAATVIVAPVTSILLQSDYVDIEVALFILGALHFCTRAPLRIRDVWLGIACLSLAVGAKILALVPVLVMSIIVLVRLIAAHGRRRTRDATLTIAGGVAAMSAVASTTYWRNWRHFHNPFWPDLEYDNAKLGIHWPGMSGAVEGPLPFFTVVEHLLDVPYNRVLGHATQVYEYGFLAGWFVFPMTAIAMGSIGVVVLRSLAGRVLNRPSLRASDASVGACYVAITLAASLYFAPTPFWGARYYIAQLGMAAVLVCWLGGRPGFQRLGEGAVAVAVIGAIISFFWVKPRWWLTPSELRTLAAIPYPEREVTPAAAISPTLGLASGSAITFDVGMARETMQRRGATLAFDDWDGNFIALFWNNEYSNRVIYIPRGDDYLERVAASEATWLYCSYADPSYAKLKQADSGWIEVGPLNVERWGSMFRRAAR